MSSTAALPPVEDRRWWNYIGPWPFQPALVFVATFLFYNIGAVGAATTSSTFDPANFLGGGLLEALLSCLPATATAWLGKRWQLSYGMRWSSYAFFIAVAVVGSVVVRYFLVLGEAFANNIFPPLFVATARITLFLLVLHALAGAVTERLERQVLATQAALDESRRQQVQILRADEDARRQVADVLHDRVQAGLIAACLELQSLPGDPQQKEAISAIVHRLEELRGIDVKRAARALSPSLQDVDLHAALRELGAQYEPSTSTRVDVPADVEKRITDPELRLGLYRITEQALMNAVIHGRAHQVEVSIRINDGNTIHWKVKDDGRGLAGGDSKQGLGSALINTWMRRLGGEWSLVDDDRGGALCRGSIPA